MSEWEDFLVHSERMTAEVRALHELANVCWRELAVDLLSLIVFAAIEERSLLLEIPEEFRLEYKSSEMEHDKIIALR